MIAYYYALFLSENVYKTSETFGEKYREKNNGNKVKNDSGCSLIENDIYFKESES